MSSNGLISFLTSSLILTGTFFSIFPVASSFLGSPFILAQVLFVALIPFSLFRRSIKALDLAFAAALLIIYTYTLLFFPEPTQGFLYLISAILFGSVARYELKKIEIFTKIVVGASIISIILSFTDGADRVIFFGGDPNFTACWLSLLMAILGSSRRYKTRLLAYVCGILIFFTLSRSGVLALLLMSSYYYFRKKSVRQYRVSDGVLFLAATFGSLLASYLVLFLAFNNTIPEYVFRSGTDRISFSSLLDVSNFIRVKANLFFVDATITDLLLGNRNPDATAYDFEGKFIRPHNLLASMIFEFGAFAAVIILIKFFRKFFWHNRMVLIWLVVFSTTLGFGSYYGFALLLVVILSNSRDIRLREASLRPIKKSATLSFVQSDATA